jgi:hypothetical protein
MCGSPSCTACTLAGRSWPLRRRCTRGRPSLLRRLREKPMGLPSLDRLLTVDCGQRGRALWTGAQLMDWRYAAYLQLRTIVPGCQGVRRTAGSGRAAAIPPSTRRRWCSPAISSWPQSPRRTVPVIGAQAAFPPGACGGPRTIPLPAAVTTAPQEPVNCPARSPIRNVMPSSALAGVHQESARCRRAPPSYDRSPSRPAVESRVRHMLGFDARARHARARCINAAGPEAADPRDPAPCTSVTQA